MNALTAKQQQLVVRHMGLVKMHVRRQLRRLVPETAAHHRKDLLQVGFFGLMQAASRYRPDRYGPFIAYAIPHVRGAICKYLAAQMDGLAVPNRATRKIFAQRKQAARQAPPGPPPMPSFHKLEEFQGLIDDQVYRAYVRHQAAQSCDVFAGPDAQGADVGDCEALDECIDEPAAQLTLQIRRRYEQAVRWAADQLKSATNCRPDRAALVEACAQERLLVPDPRYRTPKRVLTRRFACSLGRLHKCEWRLRQLIRQYLSAGVVHHASSAEVIGVPSMYAPSSTDSAKVYERDSSELRVASYE